MQELLLVNPRERAKSRKHRTAAQKAATRKLVALNRGRKTTARAANPKKRSARRKVHHVAALRSNPAPRVHHRKTRRARRHNPISIGQPMTILHPALIGALGATSVNTVLGQLAGVLPAQLMTGNALFLTKGVAAFGLAMLADKLGMKGAMVRQMAEGSLTVTLHDAILSLANSAGITQLSGMGAYMPRQPGRLAAYVGPNRALPHVQKFAGNNVGNISAFLPPQRQKTGGIGF